MKKYLYINDSIVCNLLSIVTIELITILKIIAKYCCKMQENSFNSKNVKNVQLTVTNILNVL